MRKSVLFSTLITILMFTSLTATSSYAAEQDGFAGWVYKANHFLFGINNPNSITGYQVSALPDLKPTGITYPSTIVEGDNVLFDSGVKNRGGSDSGGFNVKWFVDGQQVGYGGHGSVGAGQTVMDGNSHFTWTATAGQHTIQFVFDADNSVQESDEQGNYAEVTVSVGQTVPDACQTVISKVNAALGSSCGSASYNFGADLNSDKRVDAADSFMIDQHKYDANWCASAYLLAKNPCEPACVRANPAVALSPNSQDGTAGGNVSYKATIINNDDSACGPSVFGRSGKWWRTGTAINDITDEYAGRSLPSISPGGSLSFYIYVALLDSAQAGTYYPALLVENSAAPSYSTEASATLNVKSASTGTGTTVSCPISISVSSNKQTAYSQGETAVFTITMRDANGNVVKRGASLGISSADNRLMFGKAFPATDSGIVTVAVPLTASVYPAGAYAVQVSSDAGDCSPVSGGQSLAVQAATNQESCTDSDGGENFYVKGSTFGIEDSCYANGMTVLESYCSNVPASPEDIKSNPLIYDTGGVGIKIGSTTIVRNKEFTVSERATSDSAYVNFGSRSVVLTLGKPVVVDNFILELTSIDTVNEWATFTISERSFRYSRFSCPNGCKDGACVSAEEYAGTGYCKMEPDFGCIDLQVTTEKISVVIKSPEKSKIFDGGIYINGENCEQKDSVDFTKNPFVMTCSKKSNPGQTLKGEIVVAAQNEKGTLVRHKGSFEALVEGASTPLDLANYPYPFVKDGKLNAIMVVGDNAPSTDVIASVDIAISLKYSTTAKKAEDGTVYYETTPVEVESAKLASEVFDIKAQNAIVVGSACNNRAALELLGNPADCNFGLKPGQAVIKLLEHSNGKVALWVGGYDSLDTRRAAIVLANYKSYGVLRGIEAWVEGTTFTDMEVVLPTTPAIGKEEKLKLPPTPIEIPEKGVRLPAPAEIGKNVNKGCPQLGYRTAGRYCDADGSFKEQKTLKADCENNFECTSNTCLSGICTDLEAKLTETQNLLEKILGILGKLFGRVYE